MSSKIKNINAGNKLAEEESFNMLNNLRKYLSFWRLKVEMFLKLIKEFTNNSYKLMKNVYKYLLMYSSVSIYITRVVTHIQALKDEKIKTFDKIYDLN